MSKTSRTKHPKPRFDSQIDGWTDAYRLPIPDDASKELQKLVPEAALKEIEDATAVYRQNCDLAKSEPRQAEIKEMLLYCKSVITPVQELLLHPNNRGNKTMDSVTRDYLADKMIVHQRINFYEVAIRLKKDLRTLAACCELLLTKDFKKLRVTAPKKYHDTVFVHTLANIYQKYDGKPSDKRTSRFLRLVKHSFKALADDRADNTFSSLIHNALASK